MWLGEKLLQRSRRLCGFWELLKMQLLQEINYEYDIETGKYTGNINKFLDVVEKELGRRNIPEHLIEFVGLNRDNTIKTDLSTELVQ